MKPLFLKRMECGKHVAEVKAQTGGDVFVLERELEIIEKRATDVDPEIQEEYKTFLRHLSNKSTKDWRFVILRDNSFEHSCRTFVYTFYAAYDGTK